MRVLGCYADNFRPEAYRALTDYVPVGCLELVNTSGDTFNYWNAFSERWIGKFDLMTVEQDNVISREVFGEFRDCSELWCSFQYRAESPFSPGFMCASMGCAKFSRELQRRFPKSKISRYPVEWMYLDQTLGYRLRAAGYEPHVHGQVEHLHDYGINNESGKAKAAQLIKKASKN